MPVADVLDFVEEQVGGLAPVGQGVEGSGRDVVLDPGRDAQDGVQHVLGDPDLIEGNSDDVVGRYALVQQVVDDLELHGGFAHPAWSGHGDDGRDAIVQVLADLADEVPAGGGHRRRRLGPPPRVRLVQGFHQLGGEGQRCMRR